MNLKLKKYLTRRFLVVEEEDEDDEDDDDVVASSFVSASNGSWSFTSKVWKESEIA